MNLDETSQTLLEWYGHGKQPEPSAAERTGHAGLVGASEDAGVLQWEQPEPGTTGVRTVCRRYSCAKVTVMGETRYELWKLNKSRDWYLRVIGDLDSFADVQELAEEDLRESV